MRKKTCFCLLFSINVILFFSITPWTHFHSLLWRSVADERLALTPLWLYVIVPSSLTRLWFKRLKSEVRLWDLRINLSSTYTLHVAGDFKQQFISAVFSSESCWIFTQGGMIQENAVLHRTQEGRKHLSVHFFNLPHFTWLRLESSSHQLILFTFMNTAWNFYITGEAKF